MTVEDLQEFGVVHMTDGEIREFLSGHHVGVLGLPAEGAPSLRPLSYGYDGEDVLYLLYVVGDGSRKVSLSTRADRAQFLVYVAETPFSWRSVLATGTIRAVPESERERASEAIEGAWRPDLFETASDSLATQIYQFRVDEWNGLKHAGLPPEFERERGAE